MARMGAELRRQDFVEATIKVIAEYGVVDATTRRIAAAADSPLASLHYVFHTKDDLFYAVYESLFSQLKQALEHVPASATAAESAADMLRQLIAWLTAHPDVTRAQSELFFWTLRNKPDLAKKIYTMATEATEQAMERAVGLQLDKPRLKSASRLLVQLADGLLIAWPAHGDLEQLKVETETACLALRLLVENL